MGGEVAGQRGDRMLKSAPARSAGPTGAGSKNLS